MTDKIIAAAREAGMTTGENQKHNGEYWWRSLGRQTNVSTSDLERFYALAYRQGLEDAAKVATQIDLESQGVLPIRVALISSRIAKSILALKEQQHG